MNPNNLIDFLSKKKIPIIEKRQHTYLTYYGLEHPFAYVLKEGIVKTSIILKNGREFNLAYIKAPDIISILHEEFISAPASPFNVRVESNKATFYRIPRIQFWKYINSTPELQTYIKEYYRRNLSQAIYHQKMMIMNNKTGAICYFLNSTIEKFGQKLSYGYTIKFPITNKDIAGFCGITTSNSVNRIIHQLKEAKILDIIDKKIVIYDKHRLMEYIQE